MKTYPYKVEIDPINDLIEPIGETGLSKIIYIDEITISRNGYNFATVPQYFIEDKWKVTISTKASIVKDGLVVLSDSNEIAAGDIRTYSVDLTDILASESATQSLQCIGLLRLLCMKIVKSEIKAAEKPLLITRDDVIDPIYG